MTMMVPRTMSTSFMASRSTASFIVATVAVIVPLFFLITKKSGTITATVATMKDAVDLDAMKDVDMVLDTTTVIVMERPLLLVFDK
ncbi:hypothetical protein QR680_013791 [Steinernema hermaphroditum]|uniref:Transmembrane protein n=1 Tax=Steinernema hermaphroditum TaxID=289476 RepID=A0AA39I6P7_9BILA|nr:hypothetical protein QR680_013791 [Steinernema hermaphroditum]